MLKCCHPQEDFPGHTSTADLTPSECPEHSELALVTPLPWATPVVWWLHSFSLWEGQAHHQYSVIARWSLSYEGRLLRASGSSPRRKHNSRAELRLRTRLLTTRPVLPARLQVQSLPFLGSPPCVFCLGNRVQAVSGNKNLEFSFLPYHGNLASLCLINSLILPNSHLHQRKKVPLL